MSPSSPRPRRCAAPWRCCWAPPWSPRPPTRSRARGARPHSSRRPGAAPNPHRQRSQRRAARHRAVSAERSRQGRDRGAGPAAHGESRPRAPMTARVPIALGWLAAFVAVGVSVIVLLAWLGPVADDEWWLARGAAIQAAGFGVATWVVGRKLNRRSWAELGWWGAGTQPVAFARGVGLGVAMAVLAVALSVA